VALVLATLVSAALILAAPYIGQLRAAIQAAFPAQYVLILGGPIAAAAAAAMLIAVSRIRTRRALRFGAIAGAGLLAAAYSATTSTGNPEIDAVERVHFVEYGLIALLYYRVWNRSGDPSAFVLPLLAGVIVSTLDEWLQWFVPVRVGEAHDIVLNVAALLCGLAFAAAVWPPVSWSPRLRPASPVTIGRVAGVAVLLFAGFFSSVHLGQTVHADGVGDFVSHYSGDELSAFARERQAHWRIDPPRTLRRLSREDQYMDEGLWHIRRRNESWQAADFSRAWHENLILERFFAPVLDTPSYALREISRWSPEQRADAERRGNTPFGAPFVSDAQLYPMQTWPGWIFWVASSACALALGIGPAALARQASAAPDG
jgi:VanZ family protein